jgi:hypothetical protein
MFFQVPILWLSLANVPDSRHRESTVEDEHIHNSYSHLSWSASREDQ